MSRRRLKSKCAFCPGDLSKGGRYIYPVPQGFSKREYSNIEGALACSDCAPDIEQAQMDQGLVIPVGDQRE